MEELLENSKEIVERWKEEVDSAVVFVRAGTTILCKYPSKAHIQGWSIFSHRHSLRYWKLRVDVAKSMQRDCKLDINRPAIETSCQHLRQDTSPERRGSEERTIQANAS